MSNRPLKSPPFIEIKNLSDFSMVLSDTPDGADHDHPRGRGSGGV